ncbi:hypothetical protein NEDG_00982 [Nematocida displodere]|uniref:Uncharacterized protein n=1 Tax=Nematocida displodere TaxID=1805483 RepID=A0A177EA85_9MICR|nr:hypothetical protein NEDG_00982 [Nematocida displodere]
MAAEQKKQALVHNMKKEKDVPGYLRWQHLTSGIGNAKLPSSILLLLRVIPLTDSVIAFNDTKRLTNTLAAVTKTVSQLARQTITEKHYRQILSIFGPIYTYTLSHLKKEAVILIEAEEIENKAMHCEKKATEWVRRAYTATVGEKRRYTPEETKDLDYLLATDKEFQISIPEMDIVDRDPDKPFRDVLASSIAVSEPQGPPTPKNHTTSPNISLTYAKPANPRALSILERIRIREEERKKEFIRLEIEKDKEVEKIVHTIYLLCVSEEKRSFEKTFLQKRMPALNRGTLDINDVIKHPDARTYITVKKVEGREYLLFNLDAYKQTRTILQANAAKHSPSPN